MRFYSWSYEPESWKRKPHTHTYIYLYNMYLSLDGWRERSVDILNYIDIILILLLILICIDMSHVSIWAASDSEFPGPRQHTTLDACSKRYGRVLSKLWSWSQPGEVDVVVLILRHHVGLQFLALFLGTSPCYQQPKAIDWTGNW